MSMHIERMVAGALGFLTILPAIGAESAASELQLPEVVVTATETLLAPAAPIELLVGVMAKLQVAGGGTGGGTGDAEPACITV